MNRRSFIKGCCGGLAGLIVGCEPVLSQHRGGIVKEPRPSLLEPGEVHLPNGWTRTVTAGEAIDAGEMVGIGADGKSYGILINVMAVDTRSFEAALKKCESQIRKVLQVKYTHA